MDSFQFDEKLLAYSDEELNHFIVRLSSVPIDDAFENGVRILSSSIIAKYVSPCRSRVPADEVSAMKVAESIGIRVPQIHRIVQETGVGGSEGQFLIMSRVRGHTLEDAWPALGWWSTLKLVWQLRQYIRTMRQRTSLTAGGLISGSAFCKFWDFDSYGPELHASPENLREYMNWWILRLPSTEPRMDLEIKPFSMFTFTHMDLHTRNMMVDERSQLWLIDWGSAGFYPLFFERAALRTVGRFPPGWMGRVMAWKWIIFQTISAGSKPVEANSLSFIKFRSTRQAGARRELPSERATREAER
ncbi:kinase-like domain-containing protein [Armillaria mellea]|nr:kinase-like domain-containing protein [Armillaria mellea]